MINPIFILYPNVVRIAEDVCYDIEGKVVIIDQTKIDSYVPPPAPKSLQEQIDELTARITALETK